MAKADFALSDKPCSIERLLGALRNAIGRHAPAQPAPLNCSPTLTGFAQMNGQAWVIDN